MSTRTDLTVVYYTSNQEKESFELKIKQKLLDMIGNLPLISVSQKPIDFGTNICVGEVGVSGHNAWRQLQIGVLQATTKYICPAEADFLYPPSYFTFTPPRDDTFYRATPLYVLFAQRGKGKVFALKPRGSEAAIVVSRNLLLSRLEQMFCGRSQWWPLEDRLWLLEGCKKGSFDTGVPVVTFKTDRNMHRKTPHSAESRVKELPYWGKANDLLDMYL